MFDPGLDKAAATLARIALSAGARPDYTQGGGGNVSLKLGPERMLIKTSGSRLKDMTASCGYTLVNSGNIRRRIMAGPGEEGAFTDYLCAQALPVAGVKPAKPSIEAGFHTLLNTVVIHTHSVYANLLNMSADGEALARELFPGAEFVPYRAPGPQLCSAIAELARASGPQIFFLANHGLVTAHAGAGAAIELNSRVNEAIRLGLSLPPYPGVVPVKAGLSAHNAERLAAYGRDFMLNNVISPDQALYCGPRELDGGGNPEDVNEVLTALFYILDCMKALKFRPRFLTREETAYFAAMKSGRYRRS